MKEIFQKLKLPMIGIAVLFGGFILYKEFMKTPDPKSVITSSSEQAGPEQDFLPLLLQIQSVSFDERLFTDAVFRALVDFSQPIVPESMGKPNPFSGAISGTVNSSVESLGFVEDQGSQSTSTSRSGSIIKKK